MHSTFSRIMFLLKWIRKAKISFNPSRKMLTEIIFSDGSSGTYENSFLEENYPFFKTLFEFEEAESRFDSKDKTKVEKKIQ